MAAQVITPNGDVTLEQLSRICWLMEKHRNHLFYIPTTLMACTHEHRLCIDLDGIQHMWGLKYYTTATFPDFVKYNYRRASYYELITYGFEIWRHHVVVCRCDATDIQAYNRYIANLRMQELGRQLNDVRSIRKAMKMNRADFGKLLGVSPKTVEHWETNGLKGYVFDLIKRRCLDELAG